MPVPLLAAPWVASAVAWLLNGLRIVLMNRMGLFIVTAMVWLGINFGTIKLVLEPTIGLLTGYMDGLGGAGGDSELSAAAMQWAGVLNLDKAVTMIVSAFMTRNLIANSRMFFTKATPGA